MIQQYLISKEQTSNVKFCFRTREFIIAIVVCICPQFIKLISFHKSTISWFVAT